MSDSTSLVPASLPLFVYGTLLDSTFTSQLLERPVLPEAAELLDFELLELPGLPYPVVGRAPGHKIEGRIYRKLSQDDFGRLDAYEGVAEGLYQRAIGEVRSTESDSPSTERGYVYVPTVQTLRRYG